MILRMVGDKWAKDPVLRCLREAYWVAHTQSDYPATKTGAVITLEGRIVESASNKLMASKIMTPDEVMASAKKYDYADHAERRAIAFAAKHGRKIDGGTIYSPWTPCADCAKSIITAGLKEVITHYELNKISEDLDKNWGESQKSALDLFEANGVKFISVQRKIGNGIPIHFKGKIFYL